MKLKVMVVDDEPDIVTLVCKTLEINGMEAIRASSGAECLELLKKGESPDVIILDIMMPEKDGYAVCREIKTNAAYKDIVIIVLTAKTQNRDQVDSYKCGADGYLTKPFDPKDLISEIKTFTDMKGHF